MHVALPYSNIDYVTNYTVVKSSGQKQICNEFKKMNENF